MNAGNLVMWVVTLVFGSVALLGAAVDPPPPPPGSNGIESVGGSYVYLIDVISPNKCSIRGASQTFCFQGISQTNDNDYIYTLWQRFPSDWTVNNVYVEGTPYCISGGTFSTFDFWNASDYEVKITHVRYQANPSDSCTAFYCFEVTTGGNNPGASYATIPWYWRSSEYGSPPFYPCSSDGYTPSGEPACDESTTSPSVIFSCPQIFLPLVTK